MIKNILSLTYRRRLLFIGLFNVIIFGLIAFLFFPKFNAFAQNVINNVRIGVGEFTEVSCDGRIYTQFVKRGTLKIGCKPARSPSPTPTATSTPTATPTPTSTPTATPGSSTGGVAPVRGQKCPDWVHDRYTTTGPDGKTYKTWHAPTDAEYGCFFGHEHGSDPAKFPFLSQVGKPAFGYTAATHGMTEPHEGFKVYVVDDSERGLWWMSDFHMGTSGAKRAFQDMHTHDVVVTDRNGGILVNVHLMAHTGGSVPKCREGNKEANVIPGSGSLEGGVGKFVPTNDCTNDAYEAWNTAMNIGNMFDMRITFDVENGITALKKLPDGTYSQTETVFSGSFICGPNHKVYLPGEGPTTRPFYPYYYDADCNRTGDKRGYRLPELTLNNTAGNSEVWTDAEGNIKQSGQGIKQYISPSRRTINGSIFSNYDRYNKNDYSTYYDLDACNKNFCGPYNMAQDDFVTFPN